MEEKRVDFFVHADYPRHIPDMTITPEIEEFERRVDEVMNRAGVVAVRIRSYWENDDLLGGREFEGTFTSGAIIDGEIWDSGFLVNDDEDLAFMRLLDDIQPDIAVVHGGYLGYCIKGFIGNQLNHVRSLKDIRLGTVLRHPYEDLQKDTAKGRKRELILSRLMADETEIFFTGLDSFGRILEKK